jgi:hypothetical protein
MKLYTTLFVRGAKQYYKSPFTLVSAAAGGVLSITCFGLAYGLTNTAYLSYWEAMSIVVGGTVAFGVVGAAIGAATGPLGLPVAVVAGTVYYVKTQLA